MNQPMSPDRWQQVKQTLAEALEQHDTATRASFLSVACAGDTALRREVESLLEQPEEDAFEDCAETVGLGRPSLRDAGDRGLRIGAYQLVREIGRGGMGAVWLAVRADEEFHKEVAIKLLKRGTDTDEVLRRFRTEREILARLEHPNIARLLDGGTTADSLPYFVMEYVVGARITDYAFAQGLTIRERLELFLKICGAVQFAHQNLVVHRDLKPANILVNIDGEPKLLDFGIAKLLAAGDSAWEMTLAGRERLTPGYASPEQVRGEPVTTVSDVYALGVLMYELLTERPAHRFGRAQPTATEIQRVVCDEEPMRPSAATHDATTKRQLRGDLDTIILRALSKAPDRRYRGAGHLADDIRRHLAGFPVRARKDTVGYRAAKFIKRNKLAVAAATLIILTLVGGIVGTTYQAQIARAERAKAERRFNEVRKIANSFMFEVHNSIADLPGALAARQLVTQRALDYLDTLAQESGDDLSLAAELANAYRRIGMLTFEMHQALASHEKAVAMNERLVRAQPTNAAFRRQLADSYDELSDVMKIAGHSAAAIDDARKALAVTQSLSTGATTNAARAPIADCYIALGVALLDAGNADAALEAYHNALEIREPLAREEPNDRDVLRRLENIYSGISDVHEYRGEYETALEFTAKEMELAERVLATDAGNARCQRDMWAAQFRVARQLAATQQFDSATEHYARAVDLMEKLSAADPNDQGHRRWLAVTYSYFADLLAATNQPQAALPEYEKATAIAEDLAGDPERVEARDDLARMNESIGRLLTAQKEFGRARERLERARALAEAAAAHDPENARVRDRLAQVKEGVGRLEQAEAQASGSSVGASTH